MGLAACRRAQRLSVPSPLAGIGDKLDLTATAQSRRRSSQCMKQEAVPIGNRLLEQEAKLDNQFAGLAVNEESLRKSVRRLP